MSRKTAHDPVETAPPTPACTPRLKHAVAVFGPAVLSAVLLSWAFPRFHWHPLAWVALAPLFWRAARATPLAAAGHFLLAGWLFHSLLLQWLAANIFWAGGWALLGQQFLCLALALFWAVCGGLWAFLRQRWPRFGGPFTLGVLWVVMEWCQANLFSGFGWSALGYTQGAVPAVSQWAAVGGVGLVSLLVVLVNANLALSGRKHPLRIVTAALLLCGAFAGWFMFPLVPPPFAQFRAGLVQPMYSQEVKWDPFYAPFLLDNLDSMSRSLAGGDPAPDIIVWPEAAVPDAIPELRAAEQLSRLSKETGAWLVTGYGRYDRETRKGYNSMLVVSPETGAGGHYDKVHLAPFGEYVPFGEYLPFLNAIAFGGVSPGKEQRLLDAAGRKLGPLVCFEVLFAPMARKLRNMGADCLVVVTNLAWFGASNAMTQELEIARFRAIENRLPLIHCANSGISGVFDGYGRFTPVSARITANGQLYRYNPDEIAPAMVQGQRMMGTIDVPNPGEWPGFRFTLAMAALLLLLWAADLVLGWRKARP